VSTASLVSGKDRAPGRDNAGVAAPVEALAMVVVVVEGAGGEPQG